MILLSLRLYIVQISLLITTDEYLLDPFPHLVIQCDPDLLTKRDDGAHQRPLLRLRTLEAVG
jgi:hypothetical protein